jgi:hypothetical protein
MLISLLQVPLTSTPSSGGFIQLPTFDVALVLGFLREWWWVLMIGLVLLMVIRVLKKKLRAKRELQETFEQDVLMVVVPKESSEKGDAALQEKSLDQIKEDIAVMETVFSAIGGLKEERGFKTWLFGKHDVVSFEMVAHEGLISFYISTPKRLRAFVEGQIHSQYPHALIEDVVDYNIFTPRGEVGACEMQLTRETFFPIKTFKKMESDPLNSVTNALAKVPKPDAAVIQFVVRSAPKSWRLHGLHVTKEMKQGKRLEEAMRGVLSRMFHQFTDMLFRTKKEGEPQGKQEYRMMAVEEEMVKSIEEKSSKLGLETTIRVVTSADTKAKANMYLDNIVNAFSQYAIPEYGNSFKRVKGNPKKLVKAFIYRHFGHHGHMVFTGEELGSMYHFPLPSTETPNIRWLQARKAAPPSNLPKEGVLLGNVHYRGQDYPVRMKQADRMRHMYIIGKSGVGKSEYLKQLMKQDIEAGRGICAIDPHGDLAKDAVTLVPKERADDVIYFSPADVERPMGLNLLEYDPAFPEQKTFVVNEMLKIFDKLYDLKSTGGPMFEQYMRNAMILVMDHPESGATLMEIPRVLADEDFRKMKLQHCKTQAVKDFWEKEAQKAGGEASLANMVPYITSKLTPFITNDIMRPIIGQQKSAFNVRKAMDENKILLLDLSKGKLGDLNAYLIGMVLVGKILMAALSRQELEKSKRSDFFLYIDEFQNFITDSIAVILSEARKYGLGLVIAHQYIGQLSKNNDTAIRDAIFGNVGTMCAFRVGAEDAEFLEKEFKPTFTAFDMINCEAITANVKVLIDNTASRPFNMSLSPMVKGDLKYVDAIKQLSRLKYGRDRALVEEEILERTQGI